MVKVFNNCIKLGTAQRLPAQLPKYYFQRLAKPILGCKVIITMLDTIGKLLKKMTAKKFVCHIEQFNLFSPGLSGYRP